MLKTEIEIAQRNVRTDAYPMSVGELTNLYDDGVSATVPLGNKSEIKAN
jgi:hypothetical protein